MTYRVINFATGEIAAELHDFEMAKQLADKLAADPGSLLDSWAVVELVTRYETTARADR